MKADPNSKGIAIHPVAIHPAPRTTPRYAFIRAARRATCADSARALVTCRGAMARLYEYIDRELTPADEKAVRVHLKLCRACSRRFRFEEQLLGKIREKCGAARASEGLRRRIEAVLDEL